MQNPAITNELDHRGSKLTEMLLVCRNIPNADHIHDLRVSIRRYLAAIESLSLLAEERIYPKKIRLALKSILDSYDELRDLDVMIADLSSEAGIFNENSSFFMDLVKKEQHLREQGIVRVTGAQISEIKSQIAKTSKRVRKKLPKVKSKQIARTIDIVYQRCLELSGLVIKEKPATIHRLRIAFKKFRYVMEFFSRNLVDPPDDLFPRLRTYQTALGVVQDASVLIEVMDRFEKKEQVTVELDERGFANTRLETRIDAFMIERPNLAYFWRTSKDQQNPWMAQPTNQDLIGFIEKMKQG